MDTRQDEEQNLSKGEGAPCEPTAIHILCPTGVCRYSCCSWVTFSKEVDGRICTLATVKPFTPQNVRKPKRKLKTHSVQVPPVQLTSTGQLTG